jgi:hypothetical protein
MSNAILITGASGHFGQLMRVLVGNEQRAGLSWSPAPVNADICAGSEQDCFFLQKVNQIPP